LLQLEESQFLAYFHQTVEKEWNKAWYDRHIKKKSFSVVYRVLLYNRKYYKQRGKLEMHCLGPLYIADIKDYGVV